MHFKRVSQNKNQYLAGLFLMAAIFALTTLSLILWQYTQKASVAASTPHQDGITIEQMVGEGWHQMYTESFTTQYQTKHFNFTSADNSLSLRLSQKGLPFSDIDQIQIQACGVNIVPETAEFQDNGQSALLDIIEYDNNVVIISGRQLELTWQLPDHCYSASLTLIANEYDHASPILYPETGRQDLSYSFGTNSRTHTVDGVLAEVDGVVTADLAPVWEPITGHPHSETYIYLADDSEFFYIGLDITMDNTDEYGEDFLEIHISEDVFRVDDFDASYGKCAFGRTSQVSYKHQTCEVAIPKDEIEGDNLNFAISYYGTGGGPPPVGNWVEDTDDTFGYGYAGHSAVVFDNKIYVFGGTVEQTGTPIDFVQIYDPTETLGDRWDFDSDDPMPASRSHGGAVVVGDNIYYLLGRSDTGAPNLHDDVFIYDPDGPSTSRWTTGASAGPANARHSFGYAAEGTTIYIIGGMDNTMGGPTFYDDVFSYDTVGNTWDTSTLTAMPVSRGRITAQNIGGLIYVAGGSSTDLRIYNPTLDSWSTGSSFTGGYSPQAPCSTTYGTDFYLIGHYDEVATYRYDTVGDSWTQTENLNEVRMRCAAVELNGTLYAISGYDDDQGDFWESFDTLLVASLPLAPTINYPDDGSTRAGKVILSADYKHTAATNGTVEFRISDSAANCLSGTNIEATGSSATVSPDEAGFYDAGTLTDGTKHWCARSDDSTNQSAWTTMGSFEQDSTAPYLNYSTLLGGNDDDFVSNIAVSGSNLYFAGSTFSTDFPTTVGAYDQTYTPPSNNVVFGSLSFNGAGAADLNFASYVGADDNTFANDMFFDGTDIYIVGQTNSSSFPTTGGAYDTTPVVAPSSANGFLVRFNATGTTLEYGTYIGGSTFDDADRVYVDSGLVYVIGTATSDFPTTGGAYQTSNAGGLDMYIARFSLDGAGNADLQYSTYLGGGGDDDVNDFVVNGGDVYLGGITDTGSYPTTPGALDTAKVGFGDEGILAVLSPDGGGNADLLYSTFLGGSNQEDVESIAYDSSTGNIVGCGGARSTDMPVSGNAYDSTHSVSVTDGYVFEVNPGGNSAADLIYGSYIDHFGACTQAEYVNGDLYMVSTGVQSASFVTTSDAYGVEQKASALIRFNMGGNGASDLVYSTTIGDGTTSLSMAASGDDIYIAGATTFADTDGLFPVLADSGSPYSSTFDTDNDQFFMRFDFSGSSGGGGGGSPAPNQNPIQVQTQLATPITDGFTVLGTDQVQYNFTFPGTNQNGFNIYDQDTNQISVLTANQRQFILEDLDHNTEVSTVSIRAFNTIQESNSASWESAFTHIIPVTPRLISRNGVLEVGINEEVNNLEIGDSGIQFELLTPESPLSAVAVEQSEWSQTTTAIFNPPQDQEVQVRVRARNQEAVETEWSQYITVEGVVTPEPEPEEIEVEEEPEETPEPEIPEEEVEEAPGDEEEPAPPLPPTEDETQTIDNILTEIIDDEVSQTTPDILPTPEPEPESSRRVQTRSQSDGRSFTVEVDDSDTDEDDLVISGLATTDQRRIEFSGTTSQPNSVITLIFNQNVTVVVSSDEEGFWQTFVSAQQLGIPDDEEGEVTVDAIAAKNDLVSERVSVGAFRFELTEEDEVVAEFDSTVEDGDILTAINSILNQANDLIKEQEEVIQTTLTVAAPLVVFSSAPLWGYLPYFPTLIYHLITYLIGLFGRKKEEDHLFGQVYDSITKKPLGLAVLRIYEKDSSKLVATKVTDKLGRYDLLLEPGQYRIEVKKPQYVFPSTIVSSGPDGEHTLIYNADTGILSQEGGLQVPDIPVDPIDAKKQWSLANIFKKFWLSVQKAGHHLAVPVLFVGAIAGAISVAVVPTSLENWFIAGLYIFLLVLQLRLRTKLERAWGVVYDLATSAVLPLATIQLIDPEYGKVVKSRLTDYEGRFAFLPEPGNYIVKASKPGYEQTEVVESGDTKHKPISGEVAVKKEGQRIDGDIAMRQL